MKIEVLFLKALDLSCKFISKKSWCPYHDLGVEIPQCQKNCLNDKDGICWKIYFIREAIMNGKITKK